MKNKKRTIIGDNRTVETGDDYALDYWTQELNTTRTRLITAVAQVGNAYTDVKKELKKL